MNRLTVCALVLSALAAGVLPAALLAKEPPAVSPEGLQLAEHDRDGEIYADPDVDWSTYTEIRLEDATVAFRRNWQRDQNRGYPFKVDAKDMENMKRDLSELFREVFSAELTEDGGYVMSGTSGPNVLSIKPAIVDLDVAAPDTMNSMSSKSFTESEGRMTLKLELYDSVTGALLATARDRREAPRHGYAEWTTTVSNRAEAQSMLKTWATGLRQRLDEARSGKPLAAG
jgi:hypothetical protein